MHILPQLFVNIIKFLKDHIFFSPFKKPLELKSDSQKIEFSKYKKKFFVLSCFTLRIYLLIFIINNLTYLILFCNGILDT